MDGSDDYLFDDMVFDDQTLAVLDSEEQKFLSQTAPPPSKRRKTDNGWKPVAVPSRAVVLDDNDDLPEISVHGDGSYAFHGTTKAINQANSTHKTTVNPRGIPFNECAITSPTAVLADQNAHTEPLSRPRVSFPQSAASARLHPVQHEQTRLHQAPASDNSRIQAEELRKQIEELRRENLKYQAELKDATDAKLAKQGEVAILRKGIEKVAEDHAVQVAKLKLAKEETDAKQVALQKEMKAEMERLKTQFIFKQHELESSSRKPPASARSKRISREPSTPLALPSQMRGWNQTTSFSRFPEQSPVRSRLAKDSPQAFHSRRTPEKSRKLPKLPGFQNSFVDATPVRPSKDKGMFARASHTREASPPTSPTPFPKELMDVKMDEPGDFNEVLSEHDILDVGRTPSDEVAPVEELSGVEPFNWKAEVFILILHLASRLLMYW
ncbi:hypothetical protein B0H10DRAFT_616844 [Mycena sp. CBHHK59/15]|nr:hypothetical protein B0H10DRAFT_616844 [Mycena sp. CBHHK59/15]